MKQFTDLKLAIEKASEEVEKFDKGNATAGTRLRTLMQEVKVLTKGVRDEVTRVKTVRKKK
jgi:hypothetical protein